MADNITQASHKNKSEIVQTAPQISFGTGRCATKEKKGQTTKEKKKIKHPIP